VSAVEAGIVVALGVTGAGLGLVALTSTRAGRGAAERPPDQPSGSGGGGSGADFRELTLERLACIGATVTGATTAALYARADERVRGVAEVRSYGEAGGLMGIAAVVLRGGRPALAAAERPAAAVPVMWRGGQDAALVVAGGRGRFGPRDIAVLTEIACWSGTALDHRSLHGGPLESADAQARALQTAVAVWDDHDERRGDDLAALARALGERSGLRGCDLRELELAARLHDVGKLRVPGEVLRRGGPLNRSEWESVRMHPTWGAELVSRVPGLEAVAALIGLHHERADGQGYPHALPAERIPVAARIVAVCDAYGALRADRPYRAALSRREALAELRASRGQFDPALLDALQAHLERAPTYA
jgi:HD domain